MQNTMIKKIKSYKIDITTCILQLHIKLHECVIQSSTNINTNNYDKVLVNFTVFTKLR